MQRFVFQVIEPLISKELSEQRRKQHVNKVTQELRSFIKGELIPINKELAKKTRELFVACSDIQTLKENLQAFQRESMKLRSQIAAKDNQLVKQKMIFERDNQEMKDEIQSLNNKIKQLIRKNEDDLNKNNQEWKTKLIDTKKDLRTEHQNQMDAETKRHEQQVESLKQSHAGQKQHIIQQNSSERSKLIKKYQEKIYNLKNQSEENIEKLTQQFTQKITKLKQTKAELLNKLNNEEINCRRLTMELDRQIAQHNRFKGQFQSTFKELQNSRERYQQQKIKIGKELEQTKSTMKEMQKKYTSQIRQLQECLKKTVQQKDKKYVDTVDLMNTQHRVQVDSLRNNMMEQKQIALNAFEVKSYEQMFQQIKKYQKLQSEFKELESLYKNVKQNYQQRIKEMEEEHQLEITNLQQREEYQRSLTGESAKKEYNNLLNKFSLEIRSLKNQHLVDLENQQKKYQEEKIALSNKLISQYEAMIADQRSNTEIQLKQKFVQSERKAKAYEKRIAEAEKRKTELKVVIERMKIESQMKIESMMEVNEKLQTEIEDLHERILELQKTKSSLINDYEYQILLLKNEIEKTKEDARQRQDDLRANLNQRIVVKNKQIAKFAQKIKLQTEELIRKNRQRTNALQKQYEQLKRVINQRTSLPEDIEALKVFHAAYIEKQNQLIAQKKKREELQRTIQSKDAIEKVFVSKQSFKKFTIYDKMGQTAKNFTVRGLPSQL